MKNNGMHGNVNVSETATADNIAAFPDSNETQLQDISSLLEGAPVIQQAAANASKPASEIASAEDFEQVEEKKPFSRRLGPKAMTGAIISGFIILPLSFIFVGGDDSEQTENVAAVEESAEGNAYVSSEDYAAMQAELEQLRSQQAFTNQQVDADAIDAAGRQQQSAQAKATTQPSAAAKPSSTPQAVSNRPAPRPAPTPSRVVTPAPRSTSVAAGSQPARSIQAPAKIAEPIDPFERRAQLQELGTYGAPPPTAQSYRAVGSRTSNPFEMANPYIQAIAVESSQAQPAFSRTQATAPVERPLTEEELQYQQDANAVLALDTPEVESEALESEARDAPGRDSAVLDPRRRFVRSEESPGVESATSRDRTAIASPMAIMPGTSTQAELPYGFSWQEGTPLPEVLLMTTEDIMAGGQSVISAGTQFLGQAQVNPSSGVVNIQVVGIFGDTQNIQIPRASIAIQASDGSVLTASASGGASRSSSSNVGGFLMDSFGNSLSNILSNGDNVLMDIGGGLAETIIEGQVERAEANAATRNSRSAAQPTVWTLDPRTVQLTFNNYIPLDSASR